MILVGWLSSQDIVKETSLTLGTMLACDVFLNEKHSGKVSDTLQAVIQYLETLGVGKDDLAKVSGKLVSQIDEVTKTERKRKPGASVPAAAALDQLGQEETAEPSKKQKKEKDKDKSDKKKKSKDNGQDGGGKKSKKEK